MITAKSIQPDGQTPTGAGVEVGKGIGVALGGGVKEAVGRGLLVLVAIIVDVGTTGCVPVTEIKLNRIRACADVVSSPKKRKFGVSYGSGNPSKLL